MTERVFTNGRHAYVIEQSEASPDRHAVWFISSMGSERWPRPTLSASELDAAIANWKRGGYSERNPSAQSRAEPEPLELSEKQFDWLAREVTEWRQAKFDRCGEMSEPGDYDFEVEFQFRFGFSFTKWEKTLHSRGYDLHPPIRPGWEETCEQMWRELEEWDRENERRVEALRRRLTADGPEESGNASE